MSEGQYVDSLVNEYESLLHVPTISGSGTEPNESGILEKLVVSGDWGTFAAQELLRLAQQYGAFMLRNALALAVILGKEDGSERF